MYAESNEIGELKESLAEMKASAKAAAEMLHGFLEVGRADWQRDRVVTAEFDLSEMARSVIAPHQSAAAENGLHLKVEGATGLMVASDRLKIERIVSNLVANALKFTHRGGITVHVSRRGKDAEVAVSDTGIGISSEDQSSLFQEFFQVHNHERDRTKGFGLGLAISQRLAHQFGGEISVQSELGKGSCFRLRVPGIVACPVAEQMERATGLVPA